jgi:osmotically-inducible protein OsmY
MRAPDLVAPGRPGAGNARSDVEEKPAPLPKISPATSALRRSALTWGNGPRHPCCETEPEKRFRPEGAESAARSNTMTMTMTTVDQSLQDAVMRQLSWTPDLDASMMNATAHDGVVTLNGFVNTYAAKLVAERVTRKVYGVQGIANELEVRLAHERIDPDLAHDALEALKNRIDVPPGIGVTVRNGQVMLTGKVEWMFQKAAAERAVKYLRGVRSVSNQIEITPTVSPKDVQKRITQALHQHADLEARRIHVDAEGARVILTGNVRSWLEREEAVHAAWAAPGVTAVESRIRIAP